MKITVFSAHTSSWEPLGTMAYGNHARYCEIHDYEYRHTVLKRRTPQSLPAPWGKINLLADYCAATPEPELLGQMLIWIDADAFFTNTHPIEPVLWNAVVAAGRNANQLLITEDDNGINTGVFGLYCGVGTEDFLRSILSLSEKHRNHRWWEQAAMVEVMEQSPSAITRTIIRKRDMNSYPRDEPMGDWQPGDLILHHPGGSLQDKISELVNWTNLPMGNDGPLVMIDPAPICEPLAGFGSGTPRGETFIPRDPSKLESDIADIMATIGTATVVPSAADAGHYAMVTPKEDLVVPVVVSCPSCKGDGFHQPAQDTDIPAEGMDITCTQCRGTGKTAYFVPANSGNVLDPLPPAPGILDGTTNAGTPPPAFGSDTGTP